MSKIKDNEEGPNFLDNIYTSPTGVEVEIVKVENTALYGVRLVKGGKNPIEFNGMFTGSKLCREAIEAYFDRVEREQKVKEEDDRYNIESPATKAANKKKVS